MSFFRISKLISYVVLASLTIASPGAAHVGATTEESGAGQTGQTSGLGIIKGVVRDHGGKPIADATVALFRAGSAKALRQVRSSANGSFLLRVIPGKYSVFAVAQGFNPVSMPEVVVGSSSELNYGFKLERAGSGNTLPERRVDRNNPKWMIRSAGISRSIYQNSEGELMVETDDEYVPVDEQERSGRKMQSVASTYFVGSENGNYAGVNMATLIPLGMDAQIVIAGQSGIGANAPQRLETQLTFRPVEKHQVRVNASVSGYGNIDIGKESRGLGQISIQALDEWRVREGIVFVYGLDYSQFVGAGDAFAITPRIGFQYDLDSRTRFRTAYTSQTEGRTWSRAIELEDAQVAFREPVAVTDFVIEEGRPVMNRSSRFEFGIERVLDNRSSLDLNAFFDMTAAKGVGFAAMPFDGIGSGCGIDDIVGNQQGSAQGLRVVYSRRLNGRFTAAAGYSLGRGQKLSSEGVTNPADLFQDDFFQTFFAQVEADLGAGTSVRTVYRLSPDATVFAIDPFQGRLAIYDPSLSVMITQNLPTLGLPFHAEAIVDARNLFDFQAGVFGKEGGLKLNGQRRSLRGGIMVRF